jgi:hypothetical protein
MAFASNDLLEPVLIVLAYGCGTEFKWRGERVSRSAHLEGSLVTLEENLSTLLLMRITLALEVFTNPA